MWGPSPLDSPFYTLQNLLLTLIIHTRQPSCLGKRIRVITQLKNMKNILNMKEIKTFSFFRKKGRSVLGTEEGLLRMREAGSGVAMATILSRYANSKLLSSLISVELSSSVNKHENICLAGLLSSWLR